MAIALAVVALFAAISALVIARLIRKWRGSVKAKHRAARAGLGEDRVSDVEQVAVIFGERALVAVEGALARDVERAAEHRGERGFRVTGRAERERQERRERRIVGIVGDRAREDRDRILGAPDVA